MRGVAPGVDGVVEACVGEGLQGLLCYRVVGGGRKVAGRGVDHVVRQDAADQVCVRHGQRGDAGVGELLDVARGDAFAGLDDDVVVVGQVEVQRSEEHTSELQSLMRISYAVFCLKKKKTKMRQQLNTKNKHNS